MDEMYKASEVLLGLALVLLLIATATLALNVYALTDYVKCQQSESSLTLERYRRAVDDVQVWCGQSSPYALLIAQHIEALGEGRAHNAGTPAGEEVCSIMGLRTQLQRLEKQNTQKVLKLLSDPR